MQASFTFNSTSEADTIRLGQAIAANLPRDAVVALHGTLGSGKTRLVQAIAAAAGVDRRNVVSPTFVLVQEYFGLVAGRGLAINHIDAYRLRGAEEFQQLGGDEYLSGRGWVFVEWAQRVAELMPAARLDIHFEVTGEHTRSMKLLGTGSDMAAAVEGMASALGGETAED
jgi:tRNA threonylcarbamoyladenosine biosynthesis protein TsaE